MYKLPKDFDGSFFVGRTLEQVAFSENTVWFGFDRDVSVTVTSSLQHQCSPDDEQSPVQEVPLAESRLMQLAGHVVMDVAGDAEGTLSLLFDHGHVLRIFDDLPNYESYSINDGTREFFV